MTATLQQPHYNRSSGSQTAAVDVGRCNSLPSPQQLHAAGSVQHSSVVTVTVLRIACA
jgi:hypothetical protein